MYAVIMQIRVSLLNIILHLHVFWTQFFLKTTWGREVGRILKKVNIRSKDAEPESRKIIHYVFSRVSEELGCSPAQTVSKPTERTPKV